MTGVGKLGHRAQGVTRSVFVLALMTVPVIGCLTSCDSATSRSTSTRNAASVLPNGYQFVTDKRVVILVSDRGASVLPGGPDDTLSDAAVAGPLVAIIQRSVSSGKFVRGYVIDAERKTHRQYDDMGALMEEWTKAKERPSPRLVPVSHFSVRYL